MSNATSTRAADLAATETARMVAATPNSKALYERATRVLPQGVGSSFQAGDPYPLYLERGQGSHVWDVDGHEYLDFHNGFGCMIVGHAHPKVAEAIERAARTGTHFAAPTAATVEFAEVLCERFACDSVRFANSGTEATMGAIRIARAATGRDDIVKIEGSYHGHHDPVMFSVVPNADMMGGRDAPHSTPMSLGIPRSTSAHTHVVPFNDLTVLRGLLEARGDSIACLILEPVMMNIGICQPAPGYLQGLKDLLHEFGALLIFDEVKSGATIAYGGAVERYGVVPDLACWAKAICGGTPGAAFGGRADVMETIGRGAAQQGTFNGNPLVAAAGLATLTEVLTHDAYAYLADLGTRLATGCAEALTANGIPGHAVDLGAKGCVSYRPEPLTNYRDFLETDTDLYAASYPWAINRGIFMTPGDEEQWTISVQHTTEDIDRYVEQFADFCATVGRG
ncbi:MAG: Glutamate-semialdehyde -aminomutase [Actinomycetota bacterium]|jgi:glutamate-1-semialdehyde 2,1-aminomutase